MSKKNKKNKNKKSFNPIYEMLLKEEAAEREDVAAEKKAGKDSTPVISIKQVKSGTESVCTSKKEAAEKVDVAAANESSDDEKKSAAPKDEKEIKLSDTDAAKRIKEFFHTA